MGGDRNGAQSGSCEHHRDFSRRDSAAFGDELGLAGMDEADAVKLRLRDRAGDDRRGGARAGQADGKLERVERASGAGRIGPTRSYDASLTDGENGEGTREAVKGIGRRSDRFDRACPDRANGGDLADDEEGRKSLALPPFPAFCDDFSADPRGIAQRDGERQARTVRAVSDIRSPRRASGRAAGAERGG
jgi:hypothetical protein